MKRGASQPRAVTDTSDSAPRSPRPGSAAAAVDTGKGTRYAATFAGVRSKRQDNTPPTTPKEHPVHQELTRCLEEGLSPEEAYGVVAVIRSMRRNKNLLLRTEDVEGPERFSEYREEEGWTYHDLLREDQLTKEHELERLTCPKGSTGKQERKTLENKLLRLSRQPP